MYVPPIRPCSFARWQTVRQILRVQLSWTWRTHQVPLNSTPGCHGGGLLFYGQRCFEWSTATSEDCKYVIVTLDNPALDVLQEDVQPKCGRRSGFLAHRRIGARAKGFCFEGWRASPNP